jgi:hypothetical protein
MNATAMPQKAPINYATMIANAKGAYFLYSLRSMYTPMVTAGFKWPPENLKQIIMNVM